MNSTLDINGFNEVYVAIKPVSAQWKDLGTRLGVSKPTMDIIEANHRGDVVECLSEIISKWLERNVHDGAAVPTWRNLCIALSPIDRGLAEIISGEHGCNYISPTVSDVAFHSSVPPAFLPQSCGCGQCTIKGWTRGWMSGRVCQNVHSDRRPKLIVVNPDNPEVTELIEFARNYDRQAKLLHETSYIIECFNFVCIETWRHLKQAVDEQACSVSDIVFELSIQFNKPLPMISHLQELYCQLHSLRVSWLNFTPLHYLAQQFLSERHPDLMICWNNYRNVFKEYCAARNLKSYVDIFFQVEEQNIFLLEIDDKYCNLTLSDIEGMRDSLCHVLDVSAVCLHLVTVGEGSVIVYFYYCFSDYLIIFKSLTEEQLEMISEIKAYKILSLTDLHNQFIYDGIQSYHGKYHTSTDHAGKGAADMSLMPVTGHDIGAAYLVKKQAHVKGSIDVKKELQKQKGACIEDQIKPPPKMNVGRESGACVEDQIQPQPNANHVGRESDNLSKVEELLQENKKLKEELDMHRRKALNMAKELNDVQTVKDAFHPLNQQPQWCTQKDSRMATKLLLLGKVGQGKSTLGNFIVRNNVFQTNPGLASVTGESKLAIFSYQGKEYEVIDTPGLCDSEEIFTDKMALIEIAKGIKLSFANEKQGIDAMLLVFSVAERFGKDAEDLLSSLDKLPDFWSYTILVFTNAEMLGSNDPKEKLFEIIRNPRASPSLRSLIEKVDDRLVLLNAKDTSEENYKMKMDELLPFIKKIQKKHDDQPYTSMIFKEAIDIIKAKQELIDMTHEELEKNQQLVSSLQDTISDLNERLNFKKKAHRSYRCTVM